MVGQVTLSLEIELGWGAVQYNKLDWLSSNCEEELKTLQKLLSLCDKNEIKFSFDIVAHLMLSEQLESYDSPHPEGWFDHLPQAGRTPQKYSSPDIVDSIKNADMDHEISTHTFSHVEMGSVSEEILHWEFEKVLETHNARGISQPKSLVPPTHDLPPRDILRKYGIKVVRVPQYQAPEASTPSTPVHRFIDVITGSHPVRSPKKRNSVIETYSTKGLSLGSSILPRGQVRPHPAYRMLPLNLRKYIHLRNRKKALDASINQDSYVHFWSHLFDIANDFQWPQAEKFLNILGNKIDAGEANILTMNELVNEVRCKNNV